MYDNYVSLGRNCEAAFQFRRHLGRDVSYYFNWLVTPMDSLLAIVEADFADAFARENLRPTNDPDMILDSKYKILHHSPFRKEIGSNLDDPRFPELHAAALGKIELFKLRFRSLAQSANRVLYFIKTDEEDCRAKAVCFRDIMLARYPHHDFDILLLQLKSKAEPQWDEPRIFNRYLRRFAPMDDAIDGHAANWDALFREFPLKPGAMQVPV